MTIVGIELDDISHLPDRTLESLKTSEENNITMGGIGIIETSETIPLQVMTPKNSIHCTWRKQRSIEENGN